MITKTYLASPRTLNNEDSSDDQDNDCSSDEENIDWNLEYLIPEFRSTYLDKVGKQIKQEQELWIQQHLKREGCKTLDAFHAIFPLRRKCPTCHLDAKSNVDIVREVDIQIIGDWRCLATTGPGELFRTNNGFRL
jgi:hypothetical protein